MNAPLQRRASDNDAEEERWLESCTFALRSVCISMRPDLSASSVEERLSLSGAASQIIRVAGLSDTGVRSLLQILQGIVRPASGRYYLAGDELWQMPPMKRHMAMLKSFGISSTGSRLFPHASVEQNVAFALLVNGKSLTWAADAARRELKHLEVEHLAQMHPSELTPSQRRMVTAARALVHLPALIVCETPEADLGDYEILNLRLRLWHAAHIDGSCVLLITEHPTLSTLATTTVWLDRT